MIKDKWIRLEIKKWYGNLNLSTELAYLAHVHLGKLLPSKSMDNYPYEVQHEKEASCEELRARKSRKINASLLTLVAPKYTSS